VLWKQESFGVLRPLQIEFFRNLLGRLLLFLRRLRAATFHPSGARTQCAFFGVGEEVTNMELKEHTFVVDDYEWSCYKCRMGNRNCYPKRLQKPAPVTDEHLRWAVDSVPMGDRVRIVGYHLLDTKNEQPPYRPNPQVLSEAGNEKPFNPGHLCKEPA